MTLKEIWTLRRLEHQVFRQIVEEWEDDFGAELSLPLRDVSAHENRANGRFGAFVRRLPNALAPCDDGGRLPRRGEGDRSLAFLLWPPEHRSSYCVQPDVVPVVIDFWRKHFAPAERIFARSPAVFVTNREIQLAFADTSLGARVHYLPLSVSARHVRPVLAPRTVDLIQVGRQNSKLHRWALDYVGLRPGANYLYADTSGTWPRWTATDRGPLEVDNSRESYWALLRSSRVSLVSAPGIDGGETRTGGLNPVTPRFYESAAARCHLVGRFPRDGADFLANRVASACRHADSFEEFVEAVDRARHAPPPVAALDAFLSGHTSAEVARALRTALAAPSSALAA